MRKYFMLLMVLAMVLTAGSVFAANMLQNPSAEAGSGTGADFWVNSWGTAEASTDPAFARTGNRSWKCISGDGTAGARTVTNFTSGGQVTPVAVGETFTFSAWVKAPNASPTHQIKVRLRIGFYKPDGAWSTVQGGPYFYISSSDWTQVTAPAITCPADATVGVDPARLVTRVYVYNAYRESDTGPDVADANDGNFPVYIDDLVAESPQYTFANVSGTVTDGGAPVAGAIVKATQTVYSAADVWQISQSAPTDAAGNYTVACRVGKAWQLTASNLPAGRAVATAPAPFTPASESPITGKNITLGADPNYDPDLIFSLRGADAPATGNWPAAYPAGTMLTRIGAPSITTINGQNWENNHRMTSQDGYSFARYADPLAVSGVTIVGAVRPVYCNPGGEARGEIIDVFYDRLALAISHADGRLMVCRGGWADWGPAIPNGQITILSLVVQPDGAYEVFANGTSVMTGAANGSWYSIDPNHTSSWGSDPDFTHYITVGRNAPDGWSAFNGNIGDLYLYKTAIDPAKRQALEAAMIAKYGTSPVYTINASAGAGGTITPNGAVQVPLATDQSFTITPDKYFDVTGIAVDGAPVTVTNPNAQTYAFTNVVADHTIAVSFTEWAMTEITGKVALANGTAIEGAKITVTGGREPYTALTAADGTFAVRVKPGVSYTVTAFKRGYTMAPASLTAGTGDLTGKNFTATFVGAQKIIDLKVDDTWMDAQSINSWTNAGALGGQFISDGSKDTAVATVAASYLGKKAVVFNNSKLILSKDASSADASLIRAPESITGNGAYTLFTQIATTTDPLPGEQWYFAFAKNGGDGTAACYGYGTASAWGAVGHWGSRDMGWTNPEATGGPAPGVWHYFAVTFDGAVEKVYLDGVEVNSENKTLALYANEPFVLGSRYGDTNGWGRDGAFNGAIANLEVWDAALSAGEIGKKCGLVVFSGKTTLEDGVTPVAGVTITAYGTIGATTTSGADGKFSLGLPAGSYYITSSKDSYLQVSADYDSSVNGDITADTTYNFQLRLINAVTGIVKNAAGQPVGNAVVQVGANGPVAVTDAAGKYTVMGITPGAGTDFYADGLGYAAYNESIDTSSAANGAMTKNVTLTAKNELVVNQNGGFESGSIDPWYLNNGDPEVGVTTAEKASGNYAGYWKATTAGYYRGYLAYRLPIIDGSTYNIYFKLKTNVAGVEGQCGFDWLDAGGGSIGWWGYNGGGNNWMYTPVPNVWEQVIRYRTWNNSEQITGVRMTPPAGAKAIQIIVGMGAQNIGDTMYVDDVVIDRVGPDPTTVSGKVTNGVGGPGIPNAVVFLSATSPVDPYGSSYATTDANGFYTIQNILPGTYYLTARKGGFAAGTDVTVVVGSTPATAADIVMTPVATSKLIDLKAADYAGGVWTNKGSLGGVFNCDTATAPAAATAGSYAAVNFNGTQRLLGTMTAPNQITGNGAFTVSAWIYDAPRADYGTYLAWVRGMSTNRPESACFLYDTDGAWGALDFGSFGMGYKTLPAAGRWHNVVVTYDHAAVRVYVDGQLDNSEPVILNQIQGQPFSVGATYDVDGGATPKWFINASIASIEVFDFDKSAADVAALYHAGPDGNGLVEKKPVGVNNKTVINDAKLVGQYVRVWGKIIGKASGSYTIDDGYGVGVTIIGTTTKAIGDMVVVDGTVQSNKSVKP